MWGVTCMSEELVPVSPCFPDKIALKAPVAGFRVTLKLRLPAGFSNLGV